ncbi:MAG TPA: asparaginase [Blastocatellia bacterium]|nr:asparaginase [Blastocatellia bacterium]
MSEYLPGLVEVRRGSIVESRHHGSIVAVEPDGRLIARLGDESMVVSTRSAIKPIQAIGVVTTGAADRFNISSREMAVICSSHEGEAMHTQTVAHILVRLGLDEHSLMCGAHRPYSEETASRLDREGLPYSTLHNNCSGKHAGMLATAVHLGLSTTDYVSSEHPVQQGIVSLLGRISGFNRTITTAIDGCSAPTFGIPLISLALAFARLVNPWSGSTASGNRTPSEGSHGFMPSGLGSDEAVAAKWIIAAMTAHPEMVGGTKGRLDTDLMRVSRGKLISKIGAESVHAIGVLPGERFPRGLGLAVKIEDGAKRGLTPVVIEALSQLGILEEREIVALAGYHAPQVENHRGIRVGEVRAVFDLGYKRNL